MKIITRIKHWIDPSTSEDKTIFMAETNLHLVNAFFEHDLIQTVTDKVADKMVKEIWKKYGASLLRKVDKKTISNLTVKKLSTLIAKELK